MSDSEFTTTTATCAIACDRFYCKQKSYPTASYITCQVTVAGYAAAQVCSWSF